MNAPSMALSGWCHGRCLLLQGGGVFAPTVTMAMVSSSCNSCRSSSGMWASSTGPPSSSRVWSSPPMGRSFSVAVFNPQGTVDFPMEDEEVSPDIPVAPPPTDGRLDIVVTKEAIRNLDLSAAHAVLRKYVHQIGDNTTAPSEDPKELLRLTIGFVLEYERDNQFDPRELSEMPDIRLWFVRLDAAYPWLPVVLDWRGGELARYAAMLVPHQMSKRMGLVFNPEALELFSMNKLFIVYNWLKARNVGKPDVKANSMMKMLGFSIEDQLFSLLEKYTHT